MRSRFGLDGARIREMRIQRGWTQEQLAEIAGVSPRTIQRAETAGAASFETARGIASAFETEFQQLLRTAAGEVAGREPHADQRPAPTPPARHEVSQSDNAPHRSSTGGTGLSFLLAAALMAGLLAGVILTTRFDTTDVPRPTASLSDSQNFPQAGAGLGDRPEAVPQRAIPVPQPAPESRPATLIPERAVAREEPARLDLSVQPATFLLADTLAQVPVLPFRHPATIDALPPSRGLQSFLDPLDIPTGPDTPPSVSRASGDGQVTGAVRQAMGQTGKSIGGAFAALGTSLKRVF